MFMYGDYDSGSFSTVREQKCVKHGWLRNGAVVRSLASKCCPGSIPAQCPILVDFVGGSRFAPRVFSWFSDFLSP